jgi:hypothetical protein
MTDLNLCCIAGRHAPEVRLADVGATHNVRYQRNHQFVSFKIEIVAAEKAAQNGNIGKPRNARLGLGISPLNDSTDQIDFAVA